MKIFIKPESRTLHYIGINAFNRAEAVGSNIGINAAKTGIYRAALRSNAADPWDWESRLSMGGNRTAALSKVGVLENELILRTETGSEIGFMDALINVTKKKTIKSQSMVNRSGSVKEYIQEEDYAVKISGNLIIDDPFHFPLDDLEQLNKMLSEAESMSVASVYLNKMFGIDRLVFSNGRFNQSGVKFSNVFPIDLEFLSDIDHSFLVEDNV